MIKVDNISKRYRIGATELPYKTFREALLSGITAPVRNLSKLRSLTKFKDADEPDVIWALNGVSLEVEEGEVLGIIGKNGAGKTTLLKILSRITEPTGGTAELHGRVSSLLEVGTGFHPELTGRENIFLNGAVLGMRRKEIEEKFDDIVDFSEVWDFVDTPIKRYSTGMMVRLAFSVAAHLEPEILLVDEVLAVGDIGFQQKCLNKMENVAKGGRTVLFVSHNMGAVRSLCHNAIWIDEGRIVKKGPAGEVISDYVESQMRLLDESSHIIERDPEEVKDKDFNFSRVEVLNEEGEHTTLFRHGDKLTLNVYFDGELPGRYYTVAFRIYNELYQLVAVGESGAFYSMYFKKDINKVTIEIGPLNLTAGKYRVWLISRVEHIAYDEWEGSVGFTIHEAQPFRAGRQVTTATEGVCIIPHSFKGDRHGVGKRRK